MQSDSLKERFSEYDKPITADNIQTLRSIGRKSINDFTAEDTEKSQKWAHKFWQQLGTKSPFFRAWFGDWRANDSSSVNVTDIPSYSKEIIKKQQGEIVVCNDSLGVDDFDGWKIRVSRNGLSNTRAHSGTDQLSMLGLANIHSLIENAIILDCEVYEHHSNNAKNDYIAFDHKLYSLGRDSDGQIALYKITVEDIFQSRTNPNDLRFHNLKYLHNIEKVTDGISSSSDNKYQPYTTKDTVVTNYSVSDLFALVKKYDSSFKPREVNSTMLNEDGTPKIFYHGTPNATFTEFKDWQYFTDDKSYADVYRHQGASSNGYKNTSANPDTYAVYLRANKIFDTRNTTERKIFENEFYMKWGNGAPLSEKGLPDWTDGDDFIEFFEENGYDYDAILLDEGGTGCYGDEAKSRGISVVIRDSSQIKSAAVPKNHNHSSHAFNYLM